MGEHWIPASKASEIVGDRIALCTRLHAGLLTARAKLLIIDGKQSEWALVPKGFWWADGHEALNADWRAGDFSTWIDQKYLLQAFGVEIALAGILEMVPFEQRAMLTLSLSVASNPDWVSAREARWLAHPNANGDPRLGQVAIIVQARVGLVTGRAIAAEGVDPSGPGDDWDWSEREWNIPTWFWANFTDPDTSSKDWETGKFSGTGMAPNGRMSITLTGVHFLRANIEALAWKDGDEVKAVTTPKSTGRKPEYDWPAATNRIWGEIYRGDLVPKNQAQLESAFVRVLRKGEKEPSESTVRPYAKRIWDEMQREAENSG